MCVFKWKGFSGSRQCKRTCVISSMNYWGLSSTCSYYMVHGKTVKFFTLEYFYSWCVCVLLQLSHQWYGQGEYIFTWPLIHATRYGMLVQKYSVISKRINIITLMIYILASSVTLFRLHKVTWYMSRFSETNSITWCAKLFTLNYVT